jgi:hypothetical protein
MKQGCASGGAEADADGWIASQNGPCSGIATRLKDGEGFATASEYPENDSYA